MFFKVFRLAELYLCQKKERGCCKFTDYRSVTTVSVIAKVFEYCFVKKLNMYIKLHDLQFGFKKGGGCYKALLVFKAVVEYFNKHGSTVYVYALDLTKAYDRLNQCILILKLYDMVYQGMSS